MRASDGARGLGLGVAALLVLAGCGTCPQPTALAELTAPLQREVPLALVVDVGAAIGDRADGPVSAADPLVLAVLAPATPSSTWTAAQPQGDRRVTAVEVVEGKLVVRLLLPTAAAVGHYLLVLWPSGMDACGPAFEQPFSVQ